MVSGVNVKCPITLIIYGLGSVPTGKWVRCALREVRWGTKSVQFHGAREGVGSI